MYIFVFIFYQVLVKVIFIPIYVSMSNIRGMIPRTKFLNLCQRNMLHYVFAAYSNTNHHIE